MTSARLQTASSRIMEAGQRIGTARARVLQHLADARELIGALKILRGQKPESAQDAIDQIAKATPALIENIEQ